MNLVWTENAWEEYLYWQTTDKKILQRINELIINIKSTPFEGIGKPEPLKFEFTGYWSRKINSEHRLVYKIATRNVEIKKKLSQLQELLILQCKYHYQF